MMNMVKRSIICMLKMLLIFLVLVISYIPSRYMNSMYGYVPVIFVLVILLLTGFCLLWISKRLVFTCHDEETLQCEIGSTESIHVNVMNKSHFYSPKAVAVFYICDLSGNDLAQKNITFPISGKGQSDFSFEVMMEHVGVFQTGFKHLIIYDLFQVFRRKISKGKYNKVCVIPKIKNIEIVIDAEEFLVESQNSQKTVVNDGYDYTGVREYELGDSMKAIHWKLSAQGHGYMTKVKESSRQGDVSVILDVLSWEYDTNVRMDVYDCLVETAFSLIAGLWSKEVGYSMLFNNKENEAVRIVPKSEYSFGEVVEELAVLNIKPSKDFLGGYDLLEKEEKRGLSNVIVLCTALVDETLLQRLIRVKQRKIRPVLFYILSPNLSQHDRELKTGPLRVLDDAGIEYHTVIPKKTYVA